MSDSFEAITVEISKLELERGDVLLVRVPPSWTPEQQHNVYWTVKKTMDLAGTNTPVLIGNTDVEFQIVRKGAA